MNRRIIKRKRIEIPEMEEYDKLTQEECDACNKTVDHIHRLIEKYGFKHRDYFHMGVITSGKVPWLVYYEDARI
jgi:hypothetical protein